MDHKRKQQTRRMESIYTHLSRRERQIMDILYRKQEACVAEVQAEIETPLSGSAMRTMLRILVEKEQVHRRRVGRTHFYRPARPRDEAGACEFTKVLEVYFGGSVVQAMQVMLADRALKLDDAGMDRLDALLNQAEPRGGNGQRRTRNTKSSGTAARNETSRK